MIQPITAVKPARRRWSETHPEGVLMELRPERKKPVLETGEGSVGADETAYTRPRDGMCLRENL